MLHRIIGLAAALLCAAMPGLSHSQERPATPSATRSAAPDPKHALTDAALVGALRGGGYTLYFRHTATDFSQSDGRIDLGDCSTQRNLKDAGREQARRIGAAIRELGLPVGQVVASPYCRTMETARLIAGRAKADGAVRGRANATGAPDYSALEALLSAPPDAGTNRIVSGHGNPIRALTGSLQLEEGEALVVKPLGGDWAIAARIPIAGWEKLLAHR